MKLITKLILSFTGIAFLVVIVSLTGIKTTNDTQGEYTEVTSILWPLSKAIHEVRYFGLKTIAATAEYGFIRAENREAGFYDDFQDQQALDNLSLEAIIPFNNALEQYAGLAGNFSSEEAKIIRFAGEELIHLSAQIVEMKKQGVLGADILVAMEELAGTEHFFRQTIDAALAQITEDLTQQQSAVASSIRTGTNTIMLASVLVLCAAIFLSTIIAKRISKPIITLQMAALKLGRGDMETRVSINKNDEIGDLANAFNKMAQSLDRTTVSKDYMENILASMTDFLIVLTPDERIKRVNQVVLQQLGYREEELIGQPFSLVVEDQSWTKDGAEQITSDWSIHNCEAIYLAKDGSRVPVNISGSLLHNQDNQGIGMVYVAQDFTEKRRAQKVLENKTEELTRINQELEQFAYVVSHDLKAPLRAIANLAQWIEEDIEDVMEEETGEQLELMRGRVRRMEGLINGILEYSRIGRIEVAVETIDSKAIVEECIDSMPIPAGFTIEVGQEMPQVAANKVRFGQVLANLIDNACKFHHSPSEGRVQITAEDMNDYYRFSVTDNGPGIDPRFHEKIFGIFQTLAARDKIESTGIGLTLVKKIVEEQGGAIILESAEGQGATFRFTWPKQPMGEVA